MTPFGRPQLGDRRREQRDPAVAEAIDLRSHRGGELESRDPAIDGIDPAQQETGVGQLADERADRVCRQPQLGCGLRDRDGRTPADQANQVELRAGELRELGRPPDEPAAPPDRRHRADQVVGERRPLRAAPRRL